MVTSTSCWLPGASARPMVHSAIGGCPPRGGEMLRRQGGARAGALSAIAAMAALGAPGGVALATARSATARQLAGAPVNPLSQPVAIAKAGRSLYVLDRNAVGRFDLRTSTYSNFAGTRYLAGSADGTGAGARFNGPQGITTDGVNLYVADTGNHTVRKVVIATQAVSTIAGLAGSPGSADGTGSTARFNQPSGIGADSAN